MDVTKALLKNWGFPSTFISVGYWYSTPSEAPEEDRVIVTLIHAAKHLATQLGYGVGVDGFYSNPDEQALREAGFREEEMDEAIPDIVASIQRFIRPDGSVHFT